jgi:glutathione S-transferase
MLMIWGRLSSINVRKVALAAQRPGRPHLERWYHSILAHPAARGVLDLLLA